MSIKALIDNVLHQRQDGLLLRIMLIMTVAVFVQAITSLVSSTLLGISAQQLITDLRIRLQRHIVRLPIRFFDSNKTGVLVSRLMSDVEGIRNLAGPGLVDFMGGAMTAIIALVLLLSISPALTFIALSFLGVFGLMGRRTLMKMRPVFGERGKINAEVTGRLTESLGGIRIIKGFHAEERESRVFESGIARLFENVRKTIVMGSTLSFTSSVVTGLITIAVLLIGYELILTNRMTVGGFFAFTICLGLMAGPVLRSVNLGSQMMEAIASLDRIHEVLREVPEDADPGRHNRLDSLKGHIRFDNVGFEYDAGKPVLRGVSFEAAPGSVTAVVGPSGAGKSTLIGLIAAFAKPSQGAAHIDDLDLSTVSLESYRVHLGIVLQENFLFDGTIRENILFGRPDASDDAVLRAASMARVDEFTSRFDGGLETIIGERGVKLSGGQRQRVAIARAILADPPILLLDEATSSLDSESERLIQEGLAVLMAGRTTFVVAHRLSTIRDAHQILVLDQGEIIERGTHSELLKRKGRYYELYTSQARLEANRFINPGERELDDQAETRKRMRAAQENVDETGDPLRILRSGALD
jgi:ABC-type multidrug transport system fused ATPase/permease subunit